MTKRLFKKIKEAIGWGALVVGVVGLGVLVALAARSPMFAVTLVELSGLPEDSPVDAQALLTAADVPVGKVKMREVDLGGIASRVRSIPWVRDVSVVKQFPSSIAVRVELREPRAILQIPSGALSYVDADGVAFGKVETHRDYDFPVIHGIQPNSRAQLAGALRVATFWKETLGAVAPASAVSWEGEKGYRALVTYSLLNRSRVRSYVELGAVDDRREFDERSAKIAKVIRYLSDNNVIAHVIRAESAKKVVVKTSTSS